MHDWTIPDFDSYTVDDWKAYITQHLKMAAILESDRIVREEIATMSNEETQRRMWEAFKQEPCPISNGGSQACKELSRKFDG